MEAADPYFRMYDRRLLEERHTSILRSRPTKMAGASPDRWVTTNLWALSTTPGVRLRISATAPHFVARRYKGL
jgi:hypothetical protein